MLRKVQNKWREPAEVPFRAGYSGPLRSPRASPVWDWHGFLSLLNSYAMFSEDPLRSQAGVGAGG